MAHDDETCGKSSARSQGECACEKSLNGWQSRRLTGGKERWWLTLASGKTWQKGEEASAARGFHSWRRERVSRWARSSASGLRGLASLAGPRHESLSPISVIDPWASVRFKLWSESVHPVGCTVHQPVPVNRFSQFLKTESSL
jgi:hypothetical protein